jgi:ABC-type transport system involved in multi-copper enzyme maturation permease subunit
MVEKIINMGSLDILFSELKPIVHTYFFQLKEMWNRFVFFCIVIVLIGILIGLLPFLMIPENGLPDTQATYFEAGLEFMVLINIFSVCFFFSGIICTEFSNKTGYIVFPKINKYKLITGKFLGSLTLNIAVIAVYYYILGILGLYYYGWPINERLFLSFAIACIYVLAVASFVTLFSSFMNNVNFTIIITILILLIGFEIADEIVALSNYEIEPLYSLDYLSKLISAVLKKKFPKTREERYEDFTIEGIKYRDWITPSIEEGVIIMLIYAVLCLITAMLIFKRKQL